MTDQEKDGLVELARYADPYEAEIVRSRLESEDIPCFLFDTNHTVQVWLANSGARLLVMKSDVERARKILDQNAEIPD